LDFPNFTAEENAGKTLFISNAQLDLEGTRIGGGVGCFNCHTVPSFGFSSENRNNGVITEMEGTEVLDISRSPNLRDIFGPDGTLNGPLFHNGQAATFDELLDHYNDVSSTIEVADNKTLTGSDIYTNEKWSNPFDLNNEIEIIGGALSPTSSLDRRNAITIYPNPTANFIKFEGINERNYFGEIYSVNGQKIWEGGVSIVKEIDLSTLKKGIYSLLLYDSDKKLTAKSKFVKM